MTMPSPSPLAQQLAEHSPATPTGTTLPSRSTARQFLSYAWGIVANPIATIDVLAGERSLRWAVLVVSLDVVQVWGNMLLFAAFGFDWLGSRPLLEDPTYVGGFGYLRVPAGQWLPVFAAYMPVNALFGLVVLPGATHVLSKLWHGRASFEQMVNVLVFASLPGVLIAWASEWLTGVPLNLLSGQAYFYGAAMQGAYGPAVAVLWTVYAIAVYGVGWTWGLVLQVIGVHRVQGIPWWGATAAVLVGFGLQMLIATTFVR